MSEDRYSKWVFHDSCDLSRVKTNQGKESLFSRVAFLFLWWLLGWKSFDEGAYGPFLKNVLLISLWNWLRGLDVRAASILTYASRDKLDPEQPSSSRSDSAVAGWPVRTGRPARWTTALTSSAKVTSLTQQVHETPNKTSYHVSVTETVLNMPARLKPQHYKWR